MIDSSCLFICDVSFVCESSSKNTGLRVRSHKVTHFMTHLKCNDIDSHGCRSFTASLSEIQRKITYQTHIIYKSISNHSPPQWGCPANRRSLEHGSAGWCFLALSDPSQADDFCYKVMINKLYEAKRILKKKNLSIREASHPHIPHLSSPGHRPGQPRQAELCPPRAPRRHRHRCCSASPFGAENESILSQRKDDSWMLSRMDMF